jgi:flagellar basal body-associated protein FliL
MGKKTKIDLVKLDSPVDKMNSSMDKNEGNPSSADSNPGGPMRRGIKKSFLVFGMAGLIFLGGLVGITLKMGWISNPKKSPDKKIESPIPGDSEMGPILKLSPLIINLKEESGRHYLKTTMVLEIGKKDWVEPIQNKMSPLMDIAILTLSEKRLEDLRNLEVKEQLKQELLVKMNQHLDPKKIKQIYFDEFLYQ